MVRGGVEASDLGGVTDHPAPLGAGRGTGRLREPEAGGSGAKLGTELGESGGDVVRDEGSADEERRSDLPAGVPLATLSEPVSPPLDDGHHRRRYVFDYVAVLGVGSWDAGVNMVSRLLNSGSGARIGGYYGKLSPALAILGTRTVAIT